MPHRGRVDADVTAWDGAEPRLGVRSRGARTFHVRTWRGTAPLAGNARATPHAHHARSRANYKPKPRVEWIASLILAA